MLVTKNLLLLLLGMTILAACQPQYNTWKGTRYQLTGEVKNCEGCEVKLQLYDYNRYKTVEQLPIQTDSVQQGRFQLQGSMKRAGFYEVHIKDRVSGRRAAARIYLPSEPIHIQADLEGLPPGPLQRFNTPDYAGAFTYITATSPAPVQQELNDYWLLVDSLTAVYHREKARTLTLFRQTFTSGSRARIRQWGDSVRALTDRYPLFRAQAVDLFIRRYPRSEVAILAMLDNHHEKTNNYRFNQYVQALTPVQQTSYYGQILIRKLTVPDKPAKYKQHWVGSSITYLKGKTPAGKELDVLQVFRRNKLTLVNFWASWHGPSRWQMPAYQKLYAQNRHKGFEIIAVSFDRSYAAWTRAIAEEKLAFQHLSELKGDRAEEYRRFRIRDIPFNILFDDKGVMVGVDLTPQELHHKLPQYLQTANAPARSERLTSQAQGTKASYRQ